MHWSFEQIMTSNSFILKDEIDKSISIHFDVSQAIILKFRWLADEMNVLNNKTLWKVIEEAYGMRVIN